MSRLDANAREAAREDKERDELEISYGSGRETADRPENNKVSGGLSSVAQVGVGGGSGHPMKDAKAMYGSSTA